MTFKILYNAAVAMTGGQDAAGLRTVPEMTRMLMAEGVKHITITTDDPAKYRGVDLPTGVDVVHRDSIVAAQDKLRAIDGVTVHIHDQQCAAEKRRDRKRGIVAPASYRVMIDERVCEACGDCGVQSNCLSLHSTETEFGRKTVIDQASCNVDASCLKGDCPAFITVKPGKAKKSKRSESADGELPAPVLVVPNDIAIRMRTFTMSSVSGSEAARLAIGVRVSAGRIALKRMPSAPYWHAPLIVSALIPPLAAEYANVLKAPATGLVAATDEM